MTAVQRHRDSIRGDHFPWGVGCHGHERQDLQEGGGPGPGLRLQQEVQDDGGALLLGRLTLREPGGGGTVSQTGWV